MEGEEARAGEVARRARAEGEPRRDELAQVVEEYARLVEPARHEVEPAAERVRDRLGLVVVVEAGEVAPARVAAQLDQPCAEHDAEDEPAQAPHDGRWRRQALERAPVEEGAEEDGEEAGLEELDLP